VSASSTKFIPIAAALALLAGAATDMLRRPWPADAEPFHARVRVAAAAIPTTIPSAQGVWYGEDHEVAQSAQNLLHPNVIVQRAYKRIVDGREQAFSFLLVQCKDARDMVGHNPPRCYPGQGWQLASTRDVAWTVPDSAAGQRSVPGREFEFTRHVNLNTEQQWVDHLIILPDGGLVRDVDQINAVEANRARRFFGAAQIQLVFDDTFTEAQRRTVVAEVIGANLQLIEALCSGGKP
jgi:hypothetical protein